MSLFSHPIKKLTLLAVFGGGYVLGAKAGRDRYEQIKQTAQQVKDDPRVRDAASQAQEFVRDTAEKVKEDPRVQDVVDKATDVVDKAKHVADTAETPDTAPAANGEPAVHPLLADEHFVADEPVVYSSGPDIEESIDELAGIDATEQTFTGDDQPKG